MSFVDGLMDCQDKYNLFVFARGMAVRWVNCRDWW